MASSNPFCVGSRGWCTLVHQNHADGGGNGSIKVGIFAKHRHNSVVMNWCLLSYIVMVISK
jgi:hypothetical protein